VTAGKSLDRFSILVHELTKGLARCPRHVLIVRLDTCDPRSYGKAGPLTIGTAAEGGPEAVAATVADIRPQVNDGVLPGFTDKDEFLTYVRRRDRRAT
jgi:hypothetical protein